MQRKEFENRIKNLLPKAALDAMSNEKYNSEVFTFSVIYRYMELEKPLTGAFTIEGLTKKMDALRKAHHLL